MRLITTSRPAGPFARWRTRLAAEDGFTALIALGVLVVTSVLVAAAFTAVRGDVHLSQHDLDAKRAYDAARAGVNKFLRQLNQNTGYWSGCPTQSKAAVPGSTIEKYSFKPLPANGNLACSTSDPISTLIDKPTGTFRMQFTGYAGNPEVTRGLVASFRKRSPLDFLWYTVYEALDSGIPGFSGCGTFYRNGRSSSCNINWVSGDVMKGPMYTQDQYKILGSPTFGRAGFGDTIESVAPGSNPQDVCTNSSCGSAVFNGTRVPGAPVISPPSNNGALLTDAQLFGKVYTGTTTIALSGNTATVTNCPATCTTTTVDIAAFPVLYVNNGSGCTSAYNPFGVTYPTTGSCGNAYVSGTYTSPLTIASANDIIIKGSLTTTHNGSGNPTGNAMLGLVANNFVRVMHAVTTRDSNQQGDCGSASNVASQTLLNPTFDAAILALQHSFIVDNFDCGASLGTLTINGALAQLFRGPVGTSGSFTGYLKDYEYDDRLAVSEPPYLFDIANSGWRIVRETICVPGGSDSSTSC